MWIEDDKEIFLLTIIVEFELWMSGQDGRKEANRRLVGLPVWHLD